MAFTCFVEIVHLRPEPVPAGDAGRSSALGARRFDTQPSGCPFRRPDLAWSHPAGDRRGRRNGDGGAEFYLYPYWGLVAGRRATVLAVIAAAIVSFTIGFSEIWPGTAAKSSHSRRQATAAMAALLSSLPKQRRSSSSRAISQQARRSCRSKPARSADITAPDISPAPAATETFNNDNHGQTQLTLSDQSRSL